MTMILTLLPRLVVVGLIVREYGAIPCTWTTSVRAEANTSIKRITYGLISTQPRQPAASSTKRLRIVSGKACVTKTEPGKEHQSRALAKKPRNHKPLTAMPETRRKKRPRCTLV